MAETKLEEKFPGCGIKNDEKKMIHVDSDEVWNEYVKSHPNARDYRNTQIPLFDKLAHAFGKDRATGKGSSPPADVVEEVDREEQEQNNDEELEVELTGSPSINQS